MLAWKDFWSLFSSVIDAEKSFTNSEKVRLLVETMGDRESRRLAHEASANRTPYDDVVKALRDRYDDDRAECNHHIDNLLSRHKHGHSQADLHEAASSVR